MTKKRAPIAFVSERDGNREIYVMPAPGAQAQVQADGSGLTRLTDNAVDDHWPAWSPDGTQVAFVSTRDGDEEIYVMDADGSRPTRLTYSQGWDASPAWSPDGTRIAFNSWRDGNAEIYVMPAPGAQAQVNTDGSGLMRLTELLTDSCAVSHHFQPNQKPHCVRRSLGVKGLAPR